ncbi:MAG: ribosome silencing factor [Bacteroidia bacterium]|nr:ribosome silencing factor [Bacteroidia bacterium]
MKGTKTKKTAPNQTESLVKAAIHGLQEKKAEHIVLMDLRTSKNAVADFFIIASGTSLTHVEALARSVDEFVNKELNENPWHIEGNTNAQWVLVDYVNVVIHIFQEDTRRFYALENLWGDAQIKIINEPY